MSFNYLIWILLSNANMMQMFTRNQAMHCCSQPSTEGYTFVPKYTPHSESTLGKLLCLSHKGPYSLFNSPSRGSFHLSFLFSFLPSLGSCHSHFHLIYNHLFLFFSLYISIDAHEYNKTINILPLSNSYLK